jgi:mRNA interferase RelE/StbE
MAEYRITFARSARKELERLGDDMLCRVLSKIESLSSVPRPHDSRKLRAQSGLWRVRIGDYRVIYSIADEHRVVDVAGIRHRSDAYRAMP